MPARDYVVSLAADGPPRVRIVCFPQAAAGSAAFNAWPGIAGPSVELLAVRLPGREGLLAETLIRDMRTAGQVMAGPLSERMADGLPTALFGYCSGAFAAFETVRALTAMGVAPNLLAVCSQVAPQLAVRGSQIHGLPAPGLRDHVRGLGGTAREVIDHDELWGLIEPAVRADYEAAETYTTDCEPRINCDIVGFYGSDDTELRRAEVEAWASVTTAELTVHPLGGGHFLSGSHAAELLAGILRALPGPVRSE